MSKVNQALAAMYDTNGAGSALAEEQTKIAHLSLFAQAAAAQNIELEKMAEADREELFQAFTEKLAEESDDDEDEEKDEESDDSSDDDDDSEKDAAARAEFAAANEWQEKNAQADFLGRRMAHSFWDEYNEIQKEAKQSDSLARRIGKASGVSEIMTGRKLKSSAKTRDAARDAAANVSAGNVPAKRGETRKANAFLSRTTDQSAKAAKGDALIDAGKKKLKGHAVKGAKGLGVAAGVGGAAYAGSKAAQNKEASAGSAFDLEAGEVAIKIASDAGWDTEEVTDRLNAVLTLGPAESEKVAHANGSYEDGLAIRGLELLEAAQYPVNWDEVFGA